MWYADNLTSAQVVERCQQVLSHAWMVRTFIKHGEEVEDYPELMIIVRGVFDISMAVDSRVEDPQEYFKMLKKKLGRFRKVVDEFRDLAVQISTHTNFQQAVASIETCLADLEELLQIGQKSLANTETGPV
ncbi:MAG: amidohydrolase [Planctomycetaceae bacterium]|nr:amidohydrolase [Planctomycetaceae bacterium]